MRAWRLLRSRSADPRPRLFTNQCRRSGGQRFLLPTAVTQADLKPIVEEQGFYLLGKDIAQGYAQRLLSLLASWLKKREMAGVVLDLGHRIVVLLLRWRKMGTCCHNRFNWIPLPSIRARLMIHVHGLGSPWQYLSLPLPHSLALDESWAEW